MQQLAPGTPVRHPTFGRGIVEFPKGGTVLVRFAAAIEECLTTDLSVLQSPESCFTDGVGGQAVPATLRALAITIRAINENWGVFSPSRIDLYPHQLWVCRKVTERWPIRWVVADDVGLGKTIEAGLILWRVFHLGLVKRLLILCPASLVSQWQQRLFEMFDIRLVQYQPQHDSPRLNFWKISSHVVASFHTLREDRNGRHERMLQADKWDLVLVDEAHHLNADEESGMTLAHRLIRKLHDASLVTSLLLFTGTPHRGKHFGFFALMALVRPDLFDARKPIEPQLEKLRHALIRNNKYHVTNLRGERLFRHPEITTVAYHYTPAESAFYRMMTEFIASGRAYATGLAGEQGRSVMLVLIALQKLASSSVAAVRSALQKRLVKLRKWTEGEEVTVANINRNLATDEDDLDALNPLFEEKIATLHLELMANECKRLEELIRVADDVRDETKIQAIIAEVRRLSGDESLLFFTEYKATQSALITALWRVFGEKSATFINGEGMLSGITSPSGKPVTLRETRESAADRFNSGAVRFLVSTEAAGEGIDLQERCSRLIHVDLPWNPMRLHQRVGRLNRIGQREVVQVMLFQNPDTLESRIWELLNEKLERIRRSLNAVAEQPEDLHQLVLGVARPGILDTVFAGADAVPRENLEQWFDQQTGQIGGEDAVRAVKDLLGHAQHFDFAQVSKMVPRLDLPDLAPFFRLSVRFNRRQLTDTDGVLEFKTPEAWQRTLGIKSRYDDIHFDRKMPGRDKGTVLGVGNRLFDVALDQACEFPDSCAWVEHSGEPGTLFIFRIFDRLTGNVAQPKSVVVGVLAATGPLVLLKDWEVMMHLNGIASALKTTAESEPTPRPPRSGDSMLMASAMKMVRDTLSNLDLPFRQPDVEMVGVIASIGKS